MYGTYKWTRVDKSEKCDNYVSVVISVLFPPTPSTITQYEGHYVEVSCWVYLPHSIHWTLLMLLHPSLPVSFLAELAVVNYKHVGYWVTMVSVHLLAIDNNTNQCKTARADSLARNYVLVMQGTGVMADRIVLKIEQQVRRTYIKSMFHVGKM